MFCSFVPGAFNLARVIGSLVGDIKPSRCNGWLVFIGIDEGSFRQLRGDRAWCASCVVGACGRDCAASVGYGTGLLAVLSIGM